MEENKKPYSIGVDIGGTNTVFGVVDHRGNIIARGSIKTKKHNNFDGFLDDLHKGIMTMLETNDMQTRPSALC